MSRLTIHDLSFCSTDLEVFSETSGGFIVTLPLPSFNHAPLKDFVFGSAFALDFNHDRIANYAAGYAAGYGMAYGQSLRS